MNRHRLVLLLIAATAASGAELIIDPWLTPKLADQILVDGAPLKQFERVRVLVFSNGQLAGPTGSEPFALLSKDYATGLLRACRAQGVPCTWALDLLRWQRNNCPPSGLATAAREWLEIDAKGQITAADDAACYGSPWDPRVRAALGRLAATVASWAPQPEAVTLCCRLSPLDVLGFSPQAREASVWECQLDPIDMSYGYGPYEDGWCSWREHSLTSLLKAVIRSYRAKRPSAVFEGWSTGAYLNLSPGLRLRTCDNGMAWWREGLVADLLVDAPWAGKEVGRIWSMLVGQTKPRQAPAKPAKGQTATPQQPKPTGRLRAIVHTRDGQRRLQLSEVLAALGAQGATLRDVAFYPLSDGDLAVVQAALAAQAR